MAALDYNAPRSPPQPVGPMDVEARYKDAVRRGDTVRAQQILRGEPPSPSALLGPSPLGTVGRGMATLTPPGRGQPGLTPPPQANVGETYRGPAPSGAAQSEPTPRRPGYTIDPRPYRWFKDNDPTIAGWIDHAAEVTGASPERLAVHKWLESGKNRVSGVGKKGEIGVMQFMPGTRNQIDPQHQLDPNDGEQAMLLAGKLIHHLDYEQGLGKDTAASVAAYNGAGPRARNYARRASLEGASVPDSAFHVDPSRVTAQGAVNAAAQGGPDAALRYLVQSAPNTLPMTDKWGHLEALMVARALGKGDIAGARAARDFVGSLAYEGTNKHLMAAHQALAAGQGTVAAQHLAAAHAFFPDGTVGQFWSDGKGVYAKRLDEQDPDRSFGAQPITLDGIAAMLNTTSDPQTFLETQRKERESIAKARLASLHGDYYAQKPAADRFAVETKSADNQLRTATQAQTAAAGQANQAAIAQGRNEAAAGRNLDTQANANARAAMRQNGSNPQLDKTAAGLYDPSTAATPAQQEALGRGSGVFRALVGAGHNVQGAYAIERGLSTGAYEAVQSPDKNYVGVRDATTKREIAVVPSSVLNPLQGPMAGQARPGVASGPPTVYTARGPVAASPVASSPVASNPVPATALPATPAGAQPQAPSQAPVMRPNPYAAPQPTQGALGYGVTPVYSQPAPAGGDYMPPDDEEDD